MKTALWLQPPRGAALALSLVIMAAAAPVQAQRPTEQILFDGVADKSYFSYRIPAVISYESRSGASVIMAFAEARKRCGRDSGDIDTVVRISRDGGRSWGKRRILAGRRLLSDPKTGDKGTWGNPTAAYDARTGTVWLMLNYNREDRAQFPCKNICSAKFESRCRSQGLEKPIGVGDRKVYVMSSRDDGRKWSKPRDITAQVQLENTTWDAVGPGNGIQLKGECAAGALVFPAIGRNIYSIDGGKTWATTDRLPGGTSEATIVELSDGTLMRNDRPVARNLVSAGQRPITVSQDCGATWADWTTDPQLPTTRVHASLIRLQQQRGDVLVFANPASTKRRNTMTLRLSQDGGYTWPAARVVEPGIAAYSSLTELPDGQIGLLYEKGNNNYKSQGRIAFFQAPVRWLAQGRDGIEAAPGGIRQKPVSRQQPVPNNRQNNTSGSGWSDPDANSTNSGGSGWNNPDSTGTQQPYDPNNIQDLPWLKNKRN